MSQAPRPYILPSFSIRCKWIQGPAAAGLHHVDMAVEVHAGPGSAALAPRDYIDARIAFAVAGRAGRTHILDREATGAQAAADEFAQG